MLRKSAFLLILLILIVCYLQFCFLCNRPDANIEDRFKVFALPKKNKGSKDDVVVRVLIVKVKRNPARSELERLKYNKIYSSRDLTEEDIKAAVAYNFVHNTFPLYMDHLWSIAPKSDIPYRISKKKGYLTAEEGKKAIRMVQNYKLTSGRALKEELEASYPSIGPENRRWVAYKLRKNTFIIIVEYHICAGFYSHKALVYRWKVNSFHKTFGSANDITEFIEDSNDSRIRDKRLKGFSKKDIELFKFIFVRLDQVGGRVAFNLNMKIIPYVVREAQKTFGMGRQQIIRKYMEMDLKYDNDSGYSQFQEFLKKKKGKPIDAK